MKIAVLLFAAFGVYLGTAEMLAWFEGVGAWMDAALAFFLSVWLFLLALAVKSADW